MNHIRESIGDAACYEQLAEEASELAHACLKAARILRGENPTPAILEEVHEKVEEEYTDVIVAATVLDIRKNNLIESHKIMRWATRIKEANNEYR